MNIFDRPTGVKVSIWLSEDKKSLHVEDIELNEVVTIEKEEAEALFLRLAMIITKMEK